MIVLVSSYHLGLVHRCEAEASGHRNRQADADTDAHTHIQTDTDTETETNTQTRLRTWTQTQTQTQAQKSQTDRQRHTHRHRQHVSHASTLHTPAHTHAIHLPVHSLAPRKTPEKEDARVSRSQGEGVGESDSACALPPTSFDYPCRRYCRDRQRMLHTNQHMNTQSVLARQRCLLIIQLG